MNIFIISSNGAGLRVPAAMSITTLTLIESLLASFHQHSINYCHWKSNEHLGASMTGDTDLDILFEETQKSFVEDVLAKHGFKKFSSVKEKRYRDIEDFIGLDLPSGKIVHVHAHFRLTLGEPLLKGYQLNFEKEILSTRVFDTEFGIYRSTPAFELILLYFRQALKMRNRDIADIRFKNKIAYSGGVLKEFYWLRQRCTNEDVRSVLKPLVKNFEPISKLVTGRFNRVVVLRLAGLVKKEFKAQKLYSPLHGLLLRWYRELSLKVYRKLSRVFNQPVNVQRTNPGGGLVVAVVGADGSGKSTVIADLQTTFKKKIDVYPVYLGKGRAGGLSWKRKMLARLKAKVTGTKQVKQHKAGAATPPDNSEKKRSGLKWTVFKCVEAIIVAREKLQKLKNIEAAKKKGMLVICDRYPQNQFKGFNDGPVLHFLSQSGNPVFRLMSRIEEKIYKYAGDNPPDIVFKLVADANVISTRKPNMASPQILQAKVESIKELQFKNGCKVVTINAAEPLEQVLLAVKRELWNTMP